MPVSPPDTIRPVSTHVERNRMESNVSGRQPRCRPVPFGLSPVSAHCIDVVRPCLNRWWRRAGDGHRDRRHAFPDLEGHTMLCFAAPDAPLCPPAARPAGSPAAARTGACERPGGCRHPDCPCTSEEMASLLVTIWALRSGRVPLMPPFDRRTTEELITFWADDLTATGHPPVC
jgi:hypothetical protein